MKGPLHAGEGRAQRGKERRPEAVSPLIVLDTAHLEKQVFGDGKLRDELLRLFAGRLIALAPAVCGAPGRERREAAHTLKGASLVVGAFALARVCENVEKGNGEAARHDAALMIETTRRRVGELLRPRD